jgi:hypothetical protein
MTTKPEAIATAEAGDRGQPGSSYAIIEAQIVRIAGDRFEARAKCSAGSNQGYLQEHDSMHARGRGDTPAAAIEQIRADVMAWNIAGIPVYSERLQYDCSRELQVRRRGRHQDERRFHGGSLGSFVPLCRRTREGQERRQSLACEQLGRPHRARRSPVGRRKTGIQ